MTAGAGRKQRLKIEKVTSQEIHYHIKGITTTELLKTGLVETLLRRGPRIAPVGIMVSGKGEGYYMVHDYERPSKKPKTGVVVQGVGETDPKEMEVIVEMVRAIAERRKARS